MRFLLLNIQANMRAPWRDCKQDLMFTLFSGANKKHMPHYLLMAFVALYLLFRAPYVASVKPIPDCKFPVLQRRGLILGACSRDFGRHRLPAQYKRQLSALVHVMGRKQTAPKLAGLHGGLHRCASNHLRGTPLWCDWTFCQPSNFLPRFGSFNIT